METLTLLFFVLTLLVGALLVTQTIRRDFKARERGASGLLRHESIHARDQAGPGALHSASLHQHVHKSPPRPL